MKCKSCCVGTLHPTPNASFPGFSLNKRAFLVAAQFRTVVEGLFPSVCANGWCELKSTNVHFFGSDWIDNWRCYLWSSSTINKRDSKIDKRPNFPTTVSSTLLRINTQNVNTSSKIIDRFSWCLTSSPAQWRLVFGSYMYIAVNRGNLRSNKKTYNHPSRKNGVSAAVKNPTPWRLFRSDVTHFSPVSWLIYKHRTAVSRSNFQRKSNRNFQSPDVSPYLFRFCFLYLGSVSLCLLEKTDR